MNGQGYSRSSEGEAEPRLGLVVFPRRTQKTIERLNSNTLSTLAEDLNWKWFHIVLLETRTRLLRSSQLLLAILLLKVFASPQLRGTTNHP